MATQAELDAILAEKPEYQVAWDSFGPGLQPVFLAQSVDKLRSQIVNKAGITARDAGTKRQTDAVAESFRSKTALQTAGSSNNGGLEAIIAQVMSGAGLAGMAGGVVVANISHPNPYTYYCQPDPLITALRETWRERTDLRLRISRSGTRNEITTVVVEELIETRWNDSLKMDFVWDQSTNTTQVTLGNMEVKSTVNKTVGIGKTLLGIGKRILGARRRGIFESLSGAADFVEQITGTVTDTFVDQLQSLTLKITVWNILDEAAQPHEDSYWATKSDAERKLRAEEIERQRQEARKYCACCGTAHTQQTISAGKCKSCGFPNASDALVA